MLKFKIKLSEVECYQNLTAPRTYVEIITNLSGFYFCTNQARSSVFFCIQQLSSILNSKTINLKMLPSRDPQGTLLLEWCNHLVKSLGSQSDEEKYPTSPVSPSAAIHRLTPRNIPGRVIALLPQNPYYINIKYSTSLRTEVSGSI